MEKEFEAMEGLTPDQITHILQRQTIGRIAVVNDKVPYVVPIAFVFDGNFIYGHSREGLKISLMRKNRFVCFQVDEVDSLDAWRSVLVQGFYEELTAPREVHHAAKLIDDRFGPLWQWDITRMQAPDLSDKEVQKPEMPIYFRIRITETSGRFERRVGS